MRTIGRLSIIFFVFIASYGCSQQAGNPGTVDAAANTPPETEDAVPAPPKEVPEVRGDAGDEFDEDGLDEDAEENVGLDESDEDGLDEGDEEDEGLEEDEEEFDDFEEEFGKPEQVEVYDPISGYNRVVHVFNDKLYIWVLDPVGRGYRWVVPGIARRGVNRFFENLLYPIRVVNNLLQLKFKNAGVETVRFVTNSTLGVLGFWDPAEDLFGLKAYPEDFGQTLGHYGVGPGLHIVLPILGPSNLRDMLSMYPESYYKYDDRFYLDAISNIEKIEVYLGVYALDKINYTSLNIGKYEDLKKDAFDWYLFMRDSYEQNRNKSIKE